MSSNSRDACVVVEIHWYSFEQAGYSTLAMVFLIRNSFNVISFSIIVCLIHFILSALCSSENRRHLRNLLGCARYLSDSSESVTWNAVVATIAVIIKMIVLSVIQ